MRSVIALLAALLALSGPALADEEKLRIAVVLPYHGSYDPHWVYKAHELPEKVQEHLSVTLGEAYEIRVYPGEFETEGVTRVSLEGGKTYVIHQETVTMEEESLETEMGYALRQAARFTDRGRKGLVVILPAFLDRGGGHQGIEIPELIEKVLVEEEKVPQYAFVYEQFGITSWDRQDGLGIVPELLFENVKVELQKPLVGPNQRGEPGDPFKGCSNLLDFLRQHREEVGLLEIAFGTLRIGFWDDYKANIMYALRGVAERLGELLGVKIPVGEVDWALKNPFIRHGKAYYFAFQNPEIGPEKWERSRWEIRYEQFKKLMQDLYSQGVRYVIAFPYLTVTGITDRKLFEGNPEKGPEGSEPDVYDFPEAILRHFAGELVAETKAAVEKYTYVQDGKEHRKVVYINTRIYRLPADKLDTPGDMYVIYVRRGLLDAPGAVEKVARVIANYLSLKLPEWVHEYETLKGLAARKRAPVFPALALVAVLLPALRRR